MPVELDGVVSRSEVVAGVEDAWAALRFVKDRRTEFAVLAHFKGKDHGDQAYSRAAKYARNLAAQLDLPHLGKRAAAATNERHVAEARATPAVPSRSRGWRDVVSADTFPT